MQPRALDLLRLWYLAAHGGEARQSEIRPAMGKADRLLYLNENLIEQTETRPAIRVRLSNHGLNFLFDHMNDPVDAKTYATGPILNKVLAALFRLLQERGIGISEVFPLSAAHGQDKNKASLWSRFHSVWEEKHLPDGGLLLRDLRPALPDVSRDRLNGALLEWMSQSKIEIYPFDDNSRITQEDRDAAIVLAGREAYTVLLT